MRINFKDLFKYKEIRFLFVGVLNTIVGYGVYAFFIFIGAHYSIAFLLSSIIGVAHSYFWNKCFTFKSKDKSPLELLRFVFVYVLSYLINLFLLYVMVDLFILNKYAAGAAGIFITAVMSYVGHDKISFGKGKSE